MAVHRRHAGEKETGDYQIRGSHFFFQTDERKSRDFERLPAGTPTADRVFSLAAAVSQQYSTRRLTFLQKPRERQIAGAGAKCDFTCAILEFFFER